MGREEDLKGYGILEFSKINKICGNSVEICRNEKNCKIVQNQKSQNCKKVQKTRKISRIFQIFLNFANFFKFCKFCQNFPNFSCRNSQALTQNGSFVASNNSFYQPIESTVVPRHLISRDSLSNSKAIRHSHKKFVRSRHKKLSKSFFRLKIAR